MLDREETREGERRGGEREREGREREERGGRGRKTVICNQTTCTCSPDCLSVTKMQVQVPPH